MEQRRYTVAEIDGLRRACENMYLWGRYTGPIYREGGSGGMSRSYREDEKVKVVEEMVRTFMMSGHTAEDLYASESPRCPAVTAGLSENGVG